MNGVHPIVYTGVHLIISPPINHWGPSSLPKTANSTLTSSASYSFTPSPFSLLTNGQWKLCTERSRELRRERPYYSPTWLLSSHAFPMWAEGSIGNNWPSFLFPLSLSLATPEILLPSRSNREYCFFWVDGSLFNGG
jgi:hypothetical protein